MTPVKTPEFESRDAGFAPLSLAPLDVPPIFPSAFDELGPPAVTAGALAALQRELSAFDPTEFDDGKVFGVLVVKTPSGAFGFLKAFSGKWRGRWLVQGFAPPLFDVNERERLDAESDAVVKPLHARIEADRARVTAERGQRRDELALITERHRKELLALEARHRDNKTQRALWRQEPALTTQADRQSQTDKADKKRLLARHAAETEVAEQAIRRADRRLAAGRRLASRASANMVRRLVELPSVPNARGERRPIASFFAPGQPPGGAGECAAPKLLAHALRLGLRPVALAEFWWGPTQASGRVQGAHVPACQRKCAPLLPFMLEGLVTEVAPPRRLISRVPTDATLAVVYEDDWLRVIDKPEGLLSVPGREETHQDSVAARLPGLWVVHRLDLDTSGLLVLAKDERTHSAMQRQFATRQVAKRYVALVEGVVAQTTGTVELPLRRDVDDRPRQVHDALHGKPAKTLWQVLERTHALTRLSLAPLTGRTHQLRVHCAHALGLNAPIVGDRLYGHGGGQERLLLHCEQLTFTHPKTGRALELRSPAPF